MQDLREESINNGQGNSHQKMNVEEITFQINSVKNQLKKVIIGNDSTIDLIFTAILSEGHILLEGVPGIGKTILAKAVAKTLDIHYSRIQCTPDSMPTDITGTNVFIPKNGDFEFKKGPVFANIVLVDEINRSPAKTQAALFEVMAEKQITYDGIRYLFEPPFIILATQNPIEQEGTYRLPEAQMDRFMFKINMDFPNYEEEMAILTMLNDCYTPDIESIESVLTKESLVSLKKHILSTFTEKKILEYIANIVTKTRKHPDIYLGASPRASIALLHAGKAFACLQGRDFIIPEDIQFLAPYVIGHRLILQPEKEIDGLKISDVIANIIKSVEIPR